MWPRSRVAFCAVLLAFSPGIGAIAAATPDQLRASVARTPQSAAAHAEFGAALGEHGDISGALHELQTAVELKADYADAYYNLGTTWIKKAKQTVSGTGAYYENLDPALAALRHAYRLQPDLLHIHDLLGWLYQEIGDFHLAT